MSLLLSLSQVSLTVGIKPLFAEINLALNTGDRIGLVGHNGSGKSCLLRLLAGQIEPDSGHRQCRRNLVVALVDQFVPAELMDTTLLEAAELALPEARRSIEAYKAEAELHKLGFMPDQFEQPVNRLSGGQQNLLLMVRAILTEPDLLLLDEPGNHMDILSLTRLRQWLGGLNRPWVMVSHDRYLLNSLCRQTWVLRDQRIYEFDLPYDAAREALMHQDEQAETRRAQEEKEVARIAASAKRLAHWGHTFDNEDLSRKAKSMEKRVERLKDDYTFVSQGSGLSLSLPEEGLTARQVVAMEDLTVCIPGTDRELVRCEFLNVRPGDRVALLGVNGVGKSTTLNRVIDAVGVDSGPVRWNPRARLGYYEQQLAELDRPVSRFDWLRERVDGSDEPIRQTLLSAGVLYDRFDQPVCELSGGEKARMMFALFRLQQPNVLVLDEPTNHIDLEGRDELIESLAGSDITVLMTSHDRTFLERTATRWWWITQGRIQEVAGPDEFYRQLEQGRSEPMATSSGPGKPGRQETEPVKSDEQALERIEQLERLLDEDRARKPKHQKPERQLRWKRELTTLWSRLEGE